GRRASSSEATQGILRQPLISAFLTCSTRRLIAASSGPCARTALRLRPQVNAASRTLLRATVPLRVRVAGVGHALYPKRKNSARRSFEHGSGDSARALPLSGGGVDVPDTEPPRSRCRAGFGATSSKHRHELQDI